MNIWLEVELFLLGIPDAIWVMVVMALYLSVFAHRAHITIKEFTIND